MLAMVRMSSSPCIKSKKLYMQDGSVATLHEAIRLEMEICVPLRFSGEEIEALVKYLATLGIDSP
jgi:hypothetical protein